jgi:hypothetical protein
MVGLLLAAGVCTAWYAARLPALREQRLITAANIIKLTPARYEADASHHRVEPASFADCAYIIDMLPSNPYSGRPMHEQDVYDNADYIGNFSYLLQLSGGQACNNIVVVYAPARPGAAPGLISIGGECGCNAVFLARGIPPLDAFMRLNSGAIYAEWAAAVAAAPIQPLHLREPGTDPARSHPGHAPPAPQPPPLPSSQRP